MLKLTKTGIGLLTRQYRSVLKKCLLINLGVFAIFSTSPASGMYILYSQAHYDMYPDVSENILYASSYFEPNGYNSGAIYSISEIQNFLAEKADVSALNNYYTKV